MLLEAELTLLKDIKLAYVLVGSWILIVREHCDFLIEDQEPYFAFQLLFEPKTLCYIWRVLGKTVEKGQVDSFSELLVKCQDYFKGNLPCLGVKPTHTNFPYSCDYSPGCQVVFKGPLQCSWESLSCPACRQADQSGHFEDMWEDEEPKEPLTLPSEDKPVKEDPEESPKRRGTRQNKAKSSATTDAKRERLSEIRPWTCRLCGKILAFGNSYKHMKLVHCAGNFQCQLCEEEFKYAQDLSQHANLSHPGQTTLQCPSCEQEVAVDVDPEALVEHFKQCIKPRATDPAKRQLSKVKEESRFHQCDECGKTLSSASNLTKHMKVHSDEAQFHCHMCDYRAKWKVCLDKHIKKHLLDQGLLEKCICQLCGKELRTQKCLATHIQLVHEKSLQFQCDKCEKHFTSRDILRRHKNRVHAESDEFACKKCSYRAGNNIELKIHQRCHDQPSFKCQHCGKMLKSKGSLRIHERIHTGEKPFKCDMCDYASNNSANLLNHKKFIHHHTKKSSHNPTTTDT